VLDGQHNCIVLRGPAGVGKSRLADECLAAAEAAGARVGRATAAAAISDLPLAALAHLLPPASPDDADPRVLLERARQHLGGDGRFVLLIDDVPALDPASAVLIAQLVSADALFLIATAREGEAPPENLTAVLSGHRSLRIELAALDREGVDTLLHLALRGPLDGAAGKQLFDTSGGNPLYLASSCSRRSPPGRSSRPLVCGAWRAGCAPPRR